ncbi:MAG: hypothetical protein M3R15_24860 [Acidobacteriota bacterium]|nr:hypothetical protein [Acidobacteriota bacterium]
MAPYFVGDNAQEQAIRYAVSRTSHRVGAIRVFGPTGEIARTIQFDERARKL